MSILTQSVDSAFVEAGLRLSLSGLLRDSRAGGTLEMIPAAMTITSPTQNITTHPNRNFSPVYAAGEFLWYLTGSNSGAFIQHYAPRYKEFTSPDGTVNGAYGKRLAKVDQIGWARRLLAEEPNTRRAVLSLWHSTDLPDSYFKSPDVPCTIGVQFMIVQGRLDCFVMMRSNDLWLGFPNDAFCWTTLQILMAQSLGLRVGSYHHTANTLHIYDRHRDKLGTLARDRIDTGATLCLADEIELEPGESRFELVIGAVRTCEERLRALEPKERCGATIHDIVMGSGVNNRILERILLLAGLKGIDRRRLPAIINSFPFPFTPSLKEYMTREQH